MDSAALLQELVSLPGPPGQEEAVRRALEAHLGRRGLDHRTDAKGNLLVPFGDGRPRIVVTAHMDEIALMVREIEPDGSLRVTNLGGLYPWKCGEGPVDVLAREEILPGVLSFGSIHTSDPSSTVQWARERPLGWDQAHVFTGRSPFDLAKAGVRPGTRVVIARSRRTLTELGEFVAGHFLDDRADLVAWLLALEALGDTADVLFAATTSEEVGGEGALYLLGESRPEVCIALELGASVPDAPIALTATPTVWARDGYAAMGAGDGDMLDGLGRELGMALQFQVLSRGGSDASCAAARGLCARPITLGIPMENTHGYEIMHRDGPSELARLTVALVRRLAGGTG